MVRIRRARQLISWSMCWSIAHCPRPLRDYLLARQLFFIRLLPRWAKEFLKSVPQNSRPNVFLRGQLERFISRVAADNTSRRVFLIFSGAMFTESEGQRPTRLARELARRGIPVIFAYWRVNIAAPVQESKLPNVFCLPIDELLKYHETFFTDSRLAPLDRIFLIEFPHPSLTEIVVHANVHGWRTVYDVIDDWEEFHKRGHAFWYDREVETRLLQSVNLSTITCKRLFKKISPVNAKNARLLPNAFEDWAVSDRPPFSAARKGRITIGYFGHLSGTWFDWTLLMKVAQRRPDLVFHIIGYGLDKRLPSRDNVLFSGKVDHADLPVYARNWDAAMIPFQSSELAAAVDPIKIYEYISLGLPTVVTGMPHLASYPGVTAVEGDLEFEAAVETSARRRLDPATVEAFLEVNRWSNRIDTLLNLLDETGSWSAASLDLAQYGPPLDAAAA